MQQNNENLPRQGRTYTLLYTTSISIRNPGKDLPNKRMSVSYTPQTYHFITFCIKFLEIILVSIDNNLYLHQHLVTFYH